MNLPPSIDQPWRAARGAAPQGPLVLLHVGEDATQVAAGPGSEPQQVMTLSLGAHRLGDRGFRHDPPTAAEMEAAIMTVEDELLPMAARLPAGAVLYTADAGIRQIAHVAGLADAPRLVLSLDEVERVYQLLAAVALGRPASISGVPTDPPFAATLTLLREFMQHLGFETITIVT